MFLYIFTWAYISRGYGLFVAEHPNPFIIDPLILTAILSFGVFNLRVSNDLRFLYSPEHSLSRFEYQVHREFSGDSINSSYIAVALESAQPNDTNMLRKDIADAVEKLQNFVHHNMTIELPDGTYHFGNDICSKLPLCPISNTVVQIFFDTYFSEKLQKDPRVSLQWPVLKFFENKFFLPTNLYGVDIDEGDHTFQGLRSVQLIHLVYYVAGTDKYTGDEVSQAVEQSLRSALAEHSSLLKPAMFSFSILKSEMQKNTTYTLPFISLTVFLLMAFTIGSCMTGDWITSKPLEALMGVFSCSLAIASAAGLLFAMGIPFISQVNVMPFLAFAICVDDAYVMLGAWQDTKGNQSPNKRMALTLEEAGRLAESRIFSEEVIGRVYVNNAPDFSTHPDQLNTMMQMIEALENTPYSMGPNSTQLWLRDFYNYRQYFAEDDSNFYATLNSFLKISFNKQWASFLHWADNPNRPGKEYVKSFFFTTAFKIPDWNVRTNLLLIWRNITARYPEYQALVFDENNFFSDQMLELKATTLSSLGTAIIAMMIVCILFIAKSSIVFWVSFMLVAMNIGVAGYLSLWGSDLDPTTVVNILMSIGLCIDFATHVGYRVYKSRLEDPDERISDALGAIGYPVVQAGVSTFLAIIVMMLVPSNVVRMFARTSILVVCTWLFHGILLLPIVIRSFAFETPPTREEPQIKSALSSAKIWPVNGDEIGYE